MVFQTLEQAEQYVEPYDAESGLLKIYDSDGRVLRIRVEPKMSLTGRRYTYIEPTKPETFDQQGLKEVVFAYAEMAGLVTSETSVPELLARLASK